MGGGFRCLCPKESIASFGVSLMKTPMEHYLDDLCPVLHVTATSLGTYFNLLVWIVALESCGTRE